MKKQMSILGCGWLGIPLAKHFIEQGWSIKGSTTSSDKLKALEKEGILPFQIVLNEGQIEGDFNKFVEGSEILILNVPPGLRQNPSSNFVAKLNKVTEAISESSIHKILYVSSTGVFQDHESLPIFTEHYQFTPKEVEDSQLIQAEQLLLDLDGVQTSVLRLGGLIGKGRHPVKYLSGKTSIKNPESPVNLIHLENCMLLISEIVQQQKFGKIFHGVEDVQASKEDYYTQKAMQLNLPAPKFDHERTSAGKTISMLWTSSELGMVLKRKV
jgi:nucleoside-diphosphate-sugar epimerase